MKDFKHGASGYRRHRCRCDDCKAGHAQDSRVQRAKGVSRRPGLPSGHPIGSQAPVGTGADPEAVVGHTAPGLIERQTGRQIDDMSAGLAWTSECIRLEGQALTAARVIDQVIEDGRVHLAPAHFRLLNDAIGKLQVVLAPVRQAAVLTPAEQEIEALIRSIHTHSILCERPCRLGDDWQDADPHFSPRPSA